MAAAVRGHGDARVGAAGRLPLFDKLSMEIPNTAAQALLSLMETDEEKAGSPKQEGASLPSKEEVRKQKNRDSARRSYQRRRGGNRELEQEIDGLHAMLKSVRVYKEITRQLKGTARTGAGTSLPQAKRVKVAAKPAAARVPSPICTGPSAPDPIPIKLELKQPTMLWTADHARAQMKWAR